MSRRRAAWGVSLSALALIGCSAASRHRTLTRFFDGVPPLDAPHAASGRPQTATTIGSPSVVPVGSEHGPYAARLCEVCHVKGTNALAAPQEELCLNCHQLDLGKTYVHGPLASGGCLVCHDPHSSRYGSLLVSESGSFCLSCHDRDAVARIDGHADITEGCTTCHDAHGSDAEYLLK